MTTETDFGTYTAQDVANLVDQAVEDERRNNLVALLVLCLPTFFLGFLIGYIAG